MFDRIEHPIRSPEAVFDRVERPIWGPGASFPEIERPMWGAATTFHWVEHTSAATEAPWAAQDGLDGATTRAPRLDFLWDRGDLWGRWDRLVIPMTRSDCSHELRAP